MTTNPSTRRRRNDQDRPARGSGFLHSARWALKAVYEAQPRLLIGLTGIYFVRSLIPVSIAIATRTLINALVAATNSGGPSDKVYLWLGVAFALILFDAGTEQLNNYIRQNLSLSLATHFGIRLNQQAARMEPAMFESPALQDIATRANNSATGQLFQFLNNCLLIVTQAIELGSLLAALIYVEPLVILLLAPIALIYLLFQWRLARLMYLKDYERVTRYRLSRYLTRILTEYYWVFEIHLLALPRVLLSQFSDIVNEFLTQDRQLLRRAFWGGLIFVLAATVVIFATFLRTLGRILGGALTVGDVALYLGVVVRLRFSLQLLSGTTGSLRQGSMYVADVRQYLELRPERRRAGTQNAAGVAGQISLENVSFTYPGSENPALTNISLTIQPGEIVALVGQNGSGKSTLAKLVAGFYVPTAGVIALDGVDLQTYNLHSWQARVGYVFQAFNQYEASIGDNIAYGNWQALRDDKDAVERLAAKVGLAAQIERLPQGFDTPLGRLFGTHTLSTGQWQKIAIARALAREDARLLILDEPTASLDVQAEYEIFDQFRQMAAGKTTILISHRFSTVRMADRILVLDEGRLVEAGTHEELTAANGTYARLYDLHRSQQGL